MIYSLRRKLIWICSASVTAVFVMIFALICVLSRNQLNSVMDMIADGISENGGLFPERDDAHPAPPGDGRFPDFLTEEARSGTRFFVVRFDPDGEMAGADMDSVSSVTEETAREYAEKVLKSGEKRGWIDGYRYKLHETDAGRSVVFVDGSMNRSVSNMTLLSVGFVLVGSLAIIVVLIVIFSRRAVTPIAESYEKQKQFITDASHELKTPLTLILTNLDIVEAEAGKSEWLEDIRAEGERMNALVRQLVTLTKMDEEGDKMPVECFPVSDTISDTVSEFRGLAERRGIRLRPDIQAELCYTGNEEAVRRLVSILLDNAIRYCDPDGEVTLTFYRKRKLVLTVENSYARAEELELGRLFDRFYRADKARSYDGGFGIGLSIAKAIAHRHHGDIGAYRKEDGRVGFKVTLR